MDRRNFLRQSGLSAAGTLFIPAFLRANPVLGENELADKKMIVIQFSGGNDGLNTIIPFRQDPYFALRPRLALTASERIALTDELAINAALKPLRKHYDNGEWAIINSVGYPDPNRSHFRSMDIWQSASASDEFLSTGWLGRYMDIQNNPKGHQLLEIDDSLSLANRGQNFKALSMTNPRLLHQAMHHGWMEQVVEAGKQNQYHHHHNLQYLYQTLISTSESADYLKEKHQKASKISGFPQNRFGQQLKLIAELINAGANTSIYYTSLNGFDTHVNQKPGHTRLLKNYAESVSALIAELKKSGNFENTLIFTFSEFGRRVTQNASNGTDHGTANNVHLLSGALKNAGAINPVSDLANLVEEDLVYQVDFRDVYAEILSGWFGTNSEVILGRTTKGFGLF